MFAVLRYAGRRFCLCDDKQSSHKIDYSVSTMLVSMSTASFIESAGTPNTIPKTVDISDMIDATMTNTIFLVLLSIGSLRLSLFAAAEICLLEHAQYTTRLARFAKYYVVCRKSFFAKRI